ncbi:hypothetical protein ABTI76_001034 [Bacillus cereus]
MYPIHRSLNSFNELELSDKYRYDFLKINYNNTVLCENIFMFRTNIDNGNVFVDIIDEKHLKTINTSILNNCFIHNVQDTNFEEHSLRINNSIKIVKENYNLCSVICASFKNQEYHHSITKEKYKFNEIKYMLFQEFDNAAINNVFKLELAPIFSKQLHVWECKEEYEESLKNIVPPLTRYLYNIYKQAELSWSMELLQYRYLPTKEIKPLKYKPFI